MLRPARRLRNHAPRGWQVITVTFDQEAIAPFAKEIPCEVTTSCGLAGAGAKLVVPHTSAERTH